MWALLVATFLMVVALLLLVIARFLWWIMTKPRGPKRKQDPNPAERSVGAGGQAPGDDQKAGDRDAELTRLESDIKSRLEEAKRELETLRQTCETLRQTCETLRSQLVADVSKAIAEERAKLEPKEKRGETSDESAPEDQVGTAPLGPFSAETASSKLTVPPAAPNDAEAQASLNLALERSLVEEGWNAFCKKHAALAGELEMEESKDLELIALFLDDLKRAVSTLPQLSAAHESVSGPVAEFKEFRDRVKLIPMLVKERLRPASKQITEVLRSRELFHLVLLLQLSEFRARLSFDLAKWVREQFLVFADLFLQVYQRAQVDGGAAELEDARRLVLEILAYAHIEPVEIALGQTRFDNTLHLGRTIASQPEMQDGTIAGVVRNGFRQDGKLLRQPEVIVNRL